MRDQYSYKEKQLGNNGSDVTVPFRLETKEGSLIIQNLGKVNCLPPFTNREKQISYPVGFQSIRLFFDVVNPQIYTTYQNDISDFGDRPIFSVTPLSHPEQRVVGFSPSECWREIAAIVGRNCEEGSVCSALANKNIYGNDMFGLSYVSSIIKDMLMLEYKGFIRTTPFVSPPWYQSKPKRKRNANPKYLESPVKRRKKQNDSDSDFDFDDRDNLVNIGNTLEIVKPNNNNNQIFREINTPPNLFGVFSTLCDFLSKKKRLF